MAKDLLKLQRSPELNLRTLLRPAVFVPESKGLNELLRDFRSNRNHLAIVIDEFGNTAGLITIEDVLEEIVGEIEDEFDEQGRRVRHLHARPTAASASPATPASRPSTRPSASRCPSDEFDTIGGLVAHELGRVPRRGEAVDRRRAGVLGDADPRRRGALVQGHARARSSARLRRRLNAAAPRGRGAAARWPTGAGRCRCARAGRAADLAFVHTSAWPLPLASAALAGLAPATRAAPRRPPCSAWPTAPPGSAAGTWWLFISMHRYGGLPAWMAALAVAAAARRCCRSTWPPAWRRSRAGAAAAGGRRAAVRGRLAARRAGARRDLHRLPLGRQRLRAGRRAAGRAGAVGRRLRHRRGRRRAGGLAASLGAAGGGALALARAVALRPSCSPRWRRCSPALPSSPAPTGTLDGHAAAGQRAAGREVRADHLPAGAGLDARALLAARGDLVVAPETVDPAAAAAARPGATGRRCSRTSAQGRRRRWSACRWATTASATPTRWPASRAASADCRAASTATTSTTWCRSASSSRPASAGSRA